MLCVVYGGSRWGRLPGFASRQFGKFAFDSLSGKILAKQDPAHPANHHTRLAMRVWRPSRVGPVGNSAAVQRIG
jgi:hypothetical protein